MGLLMSGSRLLLIVGIFSVSPQALGTPGGVLCGQIFGKPPSKIAWDVDLSAKCEVSNQRNIGSCWLESSRHTVDIYLRRLGVLREDEKLSVDYYFARHVLEQLDQPDALARFVEDGASPSKLIGLVEKYGVVTSNEFSLPVYLNPKYLGVNVVFGLGGKSRFIRLSQIETVFPRKIRPFGDFEIEYISSDPRGTSRPYVEDDFYSRNKEVFDEIKKSLDEGIPVAGGFNVPICDFLALSQFGHPGCKISPQTLNFNSGIHGMAIVGYKKNDSQRITHLLIQNSWGISFGEGGRAAIDLKFIHKYLSRVALFKKSI